MNTAQFPQTPPPAAKKPIRAYTLPEIVFAWGALLYGYLFCRVFPVLDARLGGCLLILVLYIGTAVFFRVKGVHPRPLPCLIAVLSLTLTLSLQLCANELIAWLAYVFALVSYGYFIYAMQGNAIRRGLTALIVADYFNALLIYPLHSLAALKEALCSGKKAKKGGMIFAKILLGALIAVIPTAIVSSLLSYDAGFTAILKDIFAFDFAEIFSHLFSLLFGILIGMYVFSLYVSSADRINESALNETRCQMLAGAMRRVGGVTIAVASLPLPFLYVVFFISQWQYYLSAFTGVLPEELSYAQYAREGFFQLLWVAIINLGMLIGISLTLKRKTQRPPLLLKIISVVYSLFTLILISTAISKMVLYIRAYGLTQKRVYATCVMLLLAVVFVLIIVRQFFGRTPVAAVTLAAAMLMFALLSFGNMDTLIARYNIDRYLDGTLSDVDIYALDLLGDAAVPELCRMALILDQRQGSDICHAPDDDDLSDIYYDYEENRTTTYYRLRYTLAKSAEQFRKAAEQDDRNAIEKFFAFQLPAYRAESSLREIGLLE